MTSRGVPRAISRPWWNTTTRLASDTRHLACPNVETDRVLCSLSHAGCYLHLLVLRLSHRVTAGDQSDDCSLSLREIDVADQRAASCLTLRIENGQRLT